MTEEQLYDAAFATMAAEPLEFGEAQPPKRRRAKGGGRKPLPADERRRQTHIFFEPIILAAVDAYASEHEKSRSASVNQLLAEALQITGYEPGKEE
mgnify:CR=1 FL=1